MKDCTTCKYGYEDERLGIPMCHHPKRFSEDCVDFNMHEEKETEESEKPIIPITVTVLDNNLNPVEITADSEAKVEPSGSSEIPNDLEKAAKRYGNNKHPMTPTGARESQEDFIAGAKWYAEHAPLIDESDILRMGIKEGKRLMMKGAVEGTVHNFSSYMPHPTVLVDAKGFNQGDKVRVIVLPKEDSNE